MDQYRPPFMITNSMTLRISEIARKIGRIEGIENAAAKPHLRRNNRIRSIHSSLAIEANSLSVGAVKSVIDGKNVIGPEKEIQEVKNAYKAYDALGTFDPYSQDELLRLHGIMTYLTVEQSGMLRTGEEGVFNGNACIFMAPPARIVPQLMDDLFSWINAAKGTVHPLILSSAFHYELVFIHPFMDGNGRMARLWQTGLLCDWNSIFQYLPVESLICDYQSEYYAAIADSHRNGNSNVFIEFMLRMIEETVDRYIKQATESAAYDDAYIRRLLSVMETGVPYATEQILNLLGLKSRVSLRKHYLLPAMEQGLIEMSIPDKPTSRNQAYIKL